MFQAINSPKGKAIEAMFSHALRVCRLADRAQNHDHVAAWASLASVFDAELVKTRGDNFEFSTLAGSYIVNLDYMGTVWLQENILGIFPEQFSHNFRCAVEGLAYAQATRRIFRLLAERGVIDRALAENMPQRGRDHLVERIALAYLTGDEELSSSRFKHFFEGDRIDDLKTIADYFWRTGKQELSDDQRQKIIEFWQKCIEWIVSLTERPAILLSALSRLSVHVQRLGKSETLLMEEVAPFVQAGYNVNLFVEELLRLLPSEPHAVSRILKKMIEGYAPTYDYEGKIDRLVRELARTDSDLKIEAIEIADRLRQIPGMRALYTELTK